MKEFVVKVNKNEAQVLIDLCEKNGYKKRVEHDNYDMINISHDLKNYALWDNYMPNPYDNLDFYKDMDKIVESFKSEFKVGDWVYFHGEGDACLITDLWKVGKVCKITRLSDSYVGSFNINNKGVGGSNDLCNVRHATPEEIAKAKGDDIMIGEYKVKITDDGITVGCMSLTNEQVYIIKKIMSGFRILKDGGITDLDFEAKGVTHTDGSFCSYKTLKKIYKKLKS